MSPDVWQLRAEALERLITPAEFAQILAHINKRRGFKSTRKSDSADGSEAGAMLKEAAILREALQKSGKETP